MTTNLVYNMEDVNWLEASQVFEAAFGRGKDPQAMAMAFTNSMYKCFLYDGQTLIGFGRAISDGVFVAYISDIALLPDYQGQGLGKVIVEALLAKVKDHKKVILYANPGKEGFYAKLGFKKMKTAMAIFQNEEAMIELGVLSND